MLGQIFLLEMLKFINKLEQWFPRVISLYCYFRVRCRRRRRSTCKCRAFSIWPELQYQGFDRVYFCAILRN